MNRKTLEDLGLTKEQIDAVMKANGEDIEKAKGDGDQLKAEIDGLSQQIKDRDKQLTELQKAAGDNETLTKQIEDLKAANAKDAKAHAEELARLRLDSAITQALATAGAKNSKAVKALIDLTKCTVKDDGTVDGLADQIKALQGADDSKFLFKQAGGYDPAGGGTGGTRNPFAKETFNLTEQGKMLRENPAQAREMASAAGVTLNF